MEIELVKQIYKNDSFEKIQILPMSEDGFENGEKDLETVQFDYLLNKLPKFENGRYYYEKSGISDAEKTLILFKYKTQIIGIGKLIGKGNDEKVGLYLQFEPNTISICIAPIELEEMKLVLC